MLKCRQVVHPIQIAHILRTDAVYGVPLELVARIGDIHSFEGVEQRFDLQVNVVMYVVIWDSNIASWLPQRLESFHTVTRNMLLFIVSELTQTESSKSLTRSIAPTLEMGHMPCHKIGACLPRGYSRPLSPALPKLTKNGKLPKLPKVQANFTNLASDLAWIACYKAGRCARTVGGAESQMRCFLRCSALSSENSCHCLCPVG